MKARFTPQMSIDHHTTLRGISVRDIGVAPVVLVSWGVKVVKALAGAVGAQPCPHWFYNERHPFYTGEVQGHRVSFAHVPVGAPGTVLIMEEMIASGARLFLGLGWAGSLQPRAPVGTLLIPTRCIREEGTSLHYLEKDTPVTPDSRLVEQLTTAAQAEGAEVFSGPHWTTDAPYREFDTKIAEYQQQGVWGVDMETSAMYALGQFRNVPVCNLLVVSDELWEDWRPAFRTPELKAATERAQRVILRALASVATLG